MVSILFSMTGGSDVSSVAVTSSQPADLPVITEQPQPESKTRSTSHTEPKKKPATVVNTPDAITLAGHKSYIHAVAFSPDGSTIASASGDNTIKLWNSQTGKELKVLSGHVSHVYTVVYSPHGNTIASGSYDK